MMDMGIHGWGIVFWVIVAIAGIGFIVWIVQKGGRSGNEKSVEKPLDILKRRYASGEISEKEYEQMKAKLEDSEKKT